MQLNMVKIIEAKLRSNIREIIMRVQEASESSYNDIAIKMCSRLLSIYANELDKKSSAEICYMFSLLCEPHEYDVNEVTLKVNELVLELRALAESCIHFDTIDDIVSALK